MTPLFPTSDIPVPQHCPQKFVADSTSSISSSPTALPVHKVSILVPCFNAERWIAQAVQSALDQSHHDVEIIVVDDGSTDGSLDVIRSFGNRIRWESGPNNGGNRTRNRLLELATGEWIQYLDADDYLLPEKIERQLEELQAADHVDVAYSPVIFRFEQSPRPAREELFVIPEPRDPWILLIQWMLPQTSGPLWRRSALLDAGGWNENQKCCQEHELYFQLLKCGKRFQYCESVGAVYRQWSEGTVCRRNPLETFLTRMSVVKACEEFLISSGEMNAHRRDAVAHTRYQCARSIWHLDRRHAVALAKSARQAHPQFRLPRAKHFPALYRSLVSAFGFRTGELIADLARSLVKPRAHTNS